MQKIVENCFVSPAVITIKGRIGKNCLRFPEVKRNNGKKEG